MKGTKYMKQKRVSVMIIGATMLLALMAGCATTTTSTQDTANMLVAAGFKTITPKTTAQQQKLHQLQTGQVATIQKNGGTYYIVADPPQNVVYVGGPTEYQAYQQLRAQKHLAQENVQTAAMYQDASMQWSTWGGWGVGWGRMGHVAGVGRVGGVGL
jgi:ABC-type Fe3+-hydroxamate transport system substrate-binding protein